MPAGFSVAGAASPSFPAAGSAGVAAAGAAGSAVGASSPPLVGFANGLSPPSSAGAYSLVSSSANVFKLLR